MVKVDHEHIWWHYYATEDGPVWENPYEDPPEEYLSEGYRCWCGEQAHRDV